MQLGFQVQEQTIPSSTENGSDCSPDAEVSLLGSRVEEAANEDEGDHLNCSPETIENVSNDENELMV